MTTSFCVVAILMLLKLKMFRNGSMIQVLNVIHDKATNFTNAKMMSQVAKKYHDHKFLLWLLFDAVKA